MNEKIQKNYVTFTVLISAGIILRFVVMSLGYNYDFESYCVVGEIAGNFKNVYANTYRYNYGPVFFFIQGSLYRLAKIRPNEWVSVFRVLIVSVLWSVVILREKLGRLKVVGLILAIAAVFALSVL